LIFQRDTTLKLKTELEETIQRRVHTVTQELKGEADRANYEARNQQGYYKQLKRDFDHAVGMIGMLRSALEDTHGNTSWVGRWWTGRSIKRILSRLDEQFPDLDERLRYIQRKRDEAQDPEGNTNEVQTTQPVPRQAPNRWEKDWTES